MLAIFFFKKWIKGLPHINVFSTYRAVYLPSMPPHVRSSFSINFSHHHWSLDLPSEVSGLYQPAPHIHLPVKSLHHPQRCSQRPEAMVKSYWSPEVAVHTGAVLPGGKGQSWVGQVRLNVPALSPGAMKVSLAQFILWLQWVNSASPTSIESWFVIKFFNSCVYYSLEDRELAVKMHTLLPGIDFGWQSSQLEGLAWRSSSIVNNSCWFHVVFSPYSCSNLEGHKLGRVGKLQVCMNPFSLFNLHVRQQMASFISRTFVSS